MCSAVVSTRLQIHYCDQCQSAMYCSKACQKKDWKPRQKEICKFLNVGHGDMQVRTKEHTNWSLTVKEIFERRERSLNEDMKRFFKLFEESTFDGSKAAARKMKKIARRQSKHNQKFLLFHSVSFLVRSDSGMLSWPNSPLLVMLQFVDPDVMFGNEEVGTTTSLRQLAKMADPFDYSTHENQLILAKQLIEHGANVMVASTPYGRTSLHVACYSGNVTNLDFVEFLLVEGADPNAQKHQGLTPLLLTTPNAPGAAKFLLKWPTTDVNITTSSGASFLTRVRSCMTLFSVADNPNSVQDHFMLQQWRGIKEMLVERGAADTGIVFL
jgi:hypothetical protein